MAAYIRDGDRGGGNVGGVQRGTQGGVNGIMVHFGLGLAWLGLSGLGWALLGFNDISNKQ